MLFHYSFSLKIQHYFLFRSTVYNSPGNDREDTLTPEDTTTLHSYVRDETPPLDPLAPPLDILAPTTTTVDNEEDKYGDVVEIACSSPTPASPPLPPPGYVSPSPCPSSPHAGSTVDYRSPPMSPASPPSPLDHDSPPNHRKRSSSDSPPPLSRHHSRTPSPCMQFTDELIIVDEPVVVVAAGGEPHMAPLPPTPPMQALESPPASPGRPGSSVSLLLGNQDEDVPPASPEYDTDEQIEMCMQEDDEEEDKEVSHARGLTTTSATPPRLLKEDPSDPIELMDHRVRDLDEDTVKAEQTQVVEQSSDGEVKRESQAIKQQCQPVTRQFFALPLSPQQPHIIHPMSPDLTFTSSTQPRDLQSTNASPSLAVKSESSICEEAEYKKKVNDYNGVSRNQETGHSVNNGHTPIIM